ncbi:MAG: PAS domain S-box protein [Sedimentisphaerales bacterium]|nr:PAS domain S-box protein [Sedimentisphaerales bacterium]
MFFLVITGVIVTVMAGVMGRALDDAKKKVKMLSRFPSENPDPVLRIAKDGDILYSNEAGKILLSSWDSAIGGLVPEKWLDLITEAFASGKHIEEEEEAAGKVFSIVIAAVEDSGYANLYARDITETKQMQEDIANSGRVLQRIIDLLTIRIFWKDKDLNYLGCNQIFADDAGMEKPEDMVGKSDFEMGWKDQAELYRADDQNVLDSGSSRVNYEEPQTTPDGSQIWLRTSKVPLTDLQGNVIGVLGTYEDITERKQAEDEIRKNEVYLETMGDALLVVNNELKVIKVNNATAALWGYSIEELLTMSFEDLFPQRYHNKHYLLMQEALAGKVTNFETIIITKDKKEITTLLSARVLNNDKGEFTGFVGVLRDITDRKEFENELKHAKDEVEQINVNLNEAIACSTQMAREANIANRAKSEFLANMSHEIRTPMNAIIGFSDLLSQEDLSPEHAQYVNMIITSSKNLLTIIDDILDFSKIEAGKLDIEKIECSLEELLGNVSLMLKSKATEKGLDFEVRYKTTFPAFIHTDPTRVYQCLTNLIGNAIKFTDEGHVYVTVSLEEIEGNPHIRFDVEDSGIGIPVDKQDLIFESFSQADGSTTRTFGGTGLGLTITKKLAELLGGSISVESEVGKGSVFSLWVPAGIDVESQAMLGESKVEEHRQKSNNNKKKGYSGNILVAEDSVSNQKLIEILLKRLGLKVTLVDNGQQAVDTATAEMFDIIFMDMQMPVMNGYDAVGALRGKGFTVPIIALTANAMREDRDRCLEAGCDEHLPKPVDSKKIAVILEKYLVSDSSERVSELVPGCLGDA